jgi:spore maturation protein CgeB
MRILMFYHSVESDWNHGNAHFLRGVAAELVDRGHRVTVCEPADGWSARHLRADHGEAPFAAFRRRYPSVEVARYDPETVDLEGLLDGADLVIVHEWNAPGLVRQIGRVRRDGGGFRLFFHDTHHRAVTAPRELEAYDLSAYDGVLAFGQVLSDLYVRHGWSERAWTWHEAADTAWFKPAAGAEREGDLVWIGNWGDGERAAELQQFLLDPVRRLGLKARVHGVRYPDEALARLQAAGVEYAGWLPNFEVPSVFARFSLTLHVPRRPYAHALPGIPTIRVFEALACGIPLICAPWHDIEGLFRPGIDYLVAPDGTAMERLIRNVLDDRDLAASLRMKGRETIESRHTCRHRVDELLAIVASLDRPVAARASDSAFERVAR